jgi:flagellar biosynthesis protein FlhG
MTDARVSRDRGSVVAIGSGKGGVGKTSVVINLAAALARRGRRVGILDADFGLGNIDVMLGLAPTWHLGHYLSGDKTLDDVVIEGPIGIRIIPASSGVRELTALTGLQRRRLAGVIRRIAADLDFLFIDTAAGISDNVVETLLLADRTMVVTSYDPAAIVDAYALIKVLTAARAPREIGVVVSAARDADEATLVFRQLEQASSRFLNRRLQYFGAIEHDPAVRDAVLVQRPVVDHLPQARASRGFRLLASRLAADPPGGPGLVASEPSVVGAEAGPSPGEEPLCA